MLCSRFDGGAPSNHPSNSSYLIRPSRKLAYGLVFADRALVSHSRLFGASNALQKMCTQRPVWSMRATAA